MNKTLILQYFSFSIFIAALLISCGEKDIPDPIQPESYQDIDVVTGLDFFDENGNPIGRWESPNHKPGEAAVFPIPNIGIVSIYSLNKIERVWLVPAFCFLDTSTMDIPVLSQNLSYQLSEIDNAKIIDIPIADFITIANLNFSDVEKGFYRMFYQLASGELFWYNLYIDPTVNNIADFSFLNDLCN
jgi:hypothetical protein